MYVSTVRTCVIKLFCAILFPHCIFPRANSVTEWVEYNMSWTWRQESIILMQWRKIRELSFTDEEIKAVKKPRAYME